MSDIQSKRHISTDIRGGRTEWGAGQGSVAKGNNSVIKSETIPLMQLVVKQEHMVLRLLIYYLTLKISFRYSMRNCNIAMY